VEVGVFVVAGGVLRDFTYVSPGLILAGVFAEGHEAALGLSDQAAFAATTFAGLFVGTIAFGSVADRLGRRAVFTYALLWYAAATLSMGIFNFFQTIGFYGFGNWVPKLVADQGVSIEQSQLYAAIMALAYPIGPFLFALFADRFERKWQTVAAALGTAGFGLLFSLARDACAIVLLGVAITLSNNLLSYSYHAYQAEVFPTNTRARAIGFVYSFSRLSTILHKLSDRLFLGALR
jgi:MFS family permease